MAGIQYLIASNVLIRWVQPDDPGFAAATASIEKLELSHDVPCYVSQNLGEFWNVLTRPANQNGYGLSPENADALTTTVESRFRLLPDSLAVHQEWRRLLVDHRVSGVQVHDARLVAAMRVHNIERILTFNTRDFVRFQSIKAVHPLQLK
jgi:predicted nucleic acid-binding protein